jgi:uncharacterized protein YdhG (YjbR/CyaY superfamily)
MQPSPAKSTTIDEYIALYPPEVQAILQQVRQTAREVAPEAQEAIAYGIPTFKLHGNLVHFAAYKKHIGFYPTPSGLEAFKTELAGYKGSKGAVQFPLDQPIPYDLIRRITLFRVEENLRRAAAKGK